MRYSANYVDVKCPYFSSETAKAIHCEGYEKGQQRNSTLFDGKDEKEAHINKYCANYPNNCPLSKIIDKKYE